MTQAGSFQSQHSADSSLTDGRQESSEAEAFFAPGPRYPEVFINNLDLTKTQFPSAGLQIVLATSTLLVIADLVKS